MGDDSHMKPLQIHFQPLVYPEVCDVMEESLKFLPSSKSDIDAFKTSMIGVDVGCWF